MTRDSITFYGKESGAYSSKRYVDVPATYLQYFFTSRLRKLLAVIGEQYRSKSNQSLLEIGCADGVVVGRIYNTYKNIFSTISAVDISPEMIEQAKRLNESRNISFILRKDFKPSGLSDLVLEVGVINYADLREELSAASRVVSPNGFYLCSLAGKQSLWNKITDDGKNIFKTFSSYQEYEQVITEFFDIVEIVPCGLYIPLVWKVPAIGRTVTQIADMICSKIAPRLFHEQLYLLRPKKF